MKLATQSPKKALKAFLKQKPLRSDIDAFKANLIILLDKIAVAEKKPRTETEEHLKNDLRDFLRDTFYRESNAINTKDRKDLVIHLGKTTDSEVGIIIEAKRPANVAEMIAPDTANKKALHELILYYLDERTHANNHQLKHLVITNVQQWYIFDANFFDKHIYRNTKIKHLYDTKRNDKKDNPWFYEEIAKILAKIETDIPCIYFDIREYDTILRNADKADDHELSALFKILSPQHLLKIAAPNDSNSLNEKFYKELLHLIGLEEAKDGGKNIIRRKIQHRHAASLLEATIEAIHTEDVLHRIPDIAIYGDNKEDQTFNVALELCITWVNRILFLKLLEGQLIAYHQGDTAFRFLNTDTIHDFDELFKLFHKVLAVHTQARTPAIKAKYHRVPYLNSSLFDISELEDHTIKINSLDNGELLELIGTSVLKDTKKNTPALPTLDYLFQFLDAYDFASEGTAEVQEDNKTLINASVLGKVFEKINGYKDGSIFTPAFITMYMCKQSIRLAVVEKFNEALAEKGSPMFDTFEDVKNYTSRMFKTHDIRRANQIINSLRICDPAVGSGHFLVSSLNEIIAIKAELGILADEQGNCIAGYEIDIVNDELIITDQKGNICTYTFANGKPLNKEMQFLQKTLFHEKQTIIENCLFGVDINPNSVKICRLRLWIELLKNAYYKENTHFTELETLPNIDINIKCGNSLLSRFALDADLSKALKSIKYDMNAYREFVHSYKNEKNRDVKRGLQQIIDAIKADFRTEIAKNDPKKLKLSKLGGELFNLAQTGLFLASAKEEKAKKDKQAKLETEINKLAQEIEDMKNNTIYKNAFEWRFEFPEVLNDAGEFVGFDVIVGNPPYIQLQSMGKDTDALQNANYKTFVKSGDIYSLFYERGNDILKTNGTLIFITSNKWMRTSYGETTRKYIAEATNPTILIDFYGNQVFENATVDSNILQFQKNKNLQQLKALRMPKKFDFTTSIEKLFEECAVKLFVDSTSWTIQSDTVSQIKTKVEAQGVPLKDWNITINYGIKTGYNEAFIINGATKDKLIAEDAKSAEVIKPILRGQDIKAWQPVFADLFLIATFPICKINIEQYPAIKKYLLLFGMERLEQSGKKDARKKTNNKWFETQDTISYFGDFSKPKIIYPNMTKFLPFVYDENDNYLCNDKAFIITGEHIKYLVAFLNSQLFKFCFKDNFPELLGETYEVRKVFFEQVPVKQISAIAQQPFITLVDKILLAKQIGESSVEYEREIDKLVYGLYGITAEEQGLIEGVVV